MPGEARHWADAGHGSERRSPAHQSCPSLRNRISTTPSKHHRRNHYSIRRHPDKTEPQRIHAAQANQITPKVSRDSNHQPPCSGYQHIYTGQPAPAVCNHVPRNQPRAPGSSNKTRQNGIPRAIREHRPDALHIQRDSAGRGPRHPKSQTTDHTTPKAESQNNTNSHAAPTPPPPDQDGPPSSTSTVMNRPRQPWHQTARD